MKFKYLNHTADVKFQSFGSNLNEAFENAVLATSNILTDIKKIEKKLTFNIKITSKKKESLLFDFLNELIFLLDTELFIACESKIIIKYIKESEIYSLLGVLKGDKINNYKISGDIKSATYNDMEIKEDKDKVLIQVVLDL